MSNYKIISKEEISNAEVLNTINKKEKEKELTYREVKIQEYLNANKSLDMKSFKSALKELEELNIPRIEKFHLYKILEIMPKNGTELRAIVSNSGTIIVDDNATKILNVLKKYQN